MAELRGAFARKCGGGLAVARAVKHFRVMQSDAFDASASGGEKKCLGLREGRNWFKRWGLREGRGKQVIKNRVQRGSRRGPERSLFGPGDLVWFTAKARSGSGRAGA